jgi:tetratricopeptide (TPR) repeat protein
MTEYSWSVFLNDVINGRKCVEGLEIYFENQQHRQQLKPQEVETFLNMFASDEPYGVLREEEIAQRTNIAVGTLKNHRTAIYRKFGLTQKDENDKAIDPPGKKGEYLWCKLYSGYLKLKKDAESISIEPTVEQLESTPSIPPPQQRRLVGGNQIGSIPQWVGRDKLLTELTEDLKNHQVLVLHGQGGIGKTSLAVKLMAACGVEPKSDTLPATCTYTNAFYCRVNGSGSFSLIAEFLAALEIESVAGAKPEQSIGKIVAKLRQERWLVVIDNLESLMEEDGAKTKSPEVGDLLNSLAYGGHNSQIIITSRKFPVNLHDRRGNASLPGIVREVLLKGIEDADSIQLLKNLGMQDCEEDLAWIAGRVKGNVLIVKLLAQLYADKPGQLRKEPELVTSNAAPIVKKQWEKQGAAAQELLERMCVLRIEMDAAALTTLRLLQPDGGEMEFTKEAQQATQGLLDGLVKCGLVETTFDKSACESRYTLHRLIAETLQAIFENDLEGLWLYAARLYSSIDRPPEYRTFEDLQFILEEAHFYWRSATQTSYLMSIVIDDILPKLKRWCYWDLEEVWLQRILTVYTELGERAVMAGCWGVLGDLARNRGDYDKAEALYQQSLAVRTELGNRAGMAATWASLGYIALNRGDYNKAEYLYNRSLAVRTELGDRAEIAATWASLGDIASNQGDYDKAEALYNRSLAVRTELGNRATMATCWGCLGENELLRGNLEAAETWLKKALPVIEEIQLPNKIAELNWDFARLYRAKGDEPTAQAHYAISHVLYTKLGAKGYLERIEKEWDVG